MAGLGVRAFVAGFFDTAAVTAAVGEAERRGLSRFGSYVRTRAQRSLRYRLGASDPGSPPSAHRTGFGYRTDRKTGQRKLRAYSPLREFLYFAFDLATRSVVVGPAVMAGRRGDAPHALEFGGTVATPRRSKADPAARRWDQQGEFVQAADRPRVTVGGAVTIRPRPFMRPALAAEAPRFAGLFKNQFGRAA